MSKSFCPVFRKGFPVHSPYALTVESAVFDEQSLVSAAGLVPVLELAEQSGLSLLIRQQLDRGHTQIHQMLQHRLVR